MQAIVPIPPHVFWCKLTKMPKPRQALDSYRGSTWQGGGGVVESNARRFYRLCAVPHARIYMQMDQDHEGSETGEGLSVIKVSSRRSYEG